MGLALPGEMRQEGARGMHHAPEIDVEQPVHLRLVDLAELAEQRHAGIIDHDVERRMRRSRGVREIGDLAGLADVDAMRGDLSFGRRGMRLGDLGGDQLQPGLVAIGEREIGAARRQFERQRAADAARRPGHSGGRALKSQS